MKYETSIELVQMESNNEGDKESLVENKVRACNPKGFHIFHNCVLNLIGLQGLFRVIFFIIKWKMLCQLTIEQIGLQTLQFHTFTTLILYISREGFRWGCLGQKNNDVGQDIDSRMIQSNSRVLAVAWLTIPWGVIVTTIILPLTMWWQGLHVLSDYNSSIFILGIATILELCSEPFYILAQHLLWLPLCVIIKVVATITQFGVTYFFVDQGIRLDGGKAIVYGQVAYSCCLLLCYWSYFLFNYEGQIFPFKLVYYKSNVFCFGLKKNLELDISLMKLCFSFSLTSGLLKLILQDSGKWILMFYETTHNQGVYGLIDNIGSLVVRYIFQPFEESAFIMFAKESSTNSAIDKNNNNYCNIECIFLLVLKLAIFIGLVFVTLGPNFAYVLLRLYNKDWSDGNATNALGYYCIYILILAINGVSETFLRAVIKQQELLNWKFIPKFISLTMASVCFHMVFIYSASSNGLILAKSIIMGMQLYYSLHFIQNYFKHSKTFSLWKALPNWRVLGVLVTSAFVTYLSKSLVLDLKNFFPTAILHIGVGMACLGGLFVVVFKYERRFLQEIVAFQNKKRD